MKYFKYMLRNVLRNKLRSLLTILALWMCLMLMTFLYGYLAIMEVWSSEAAKYNRVVVMNVQGFAAPLRYATLDRVREMPGVEAAVPYSWFGGLYKDERFSFAQFATDPKYVFDVWKEFKIDPEQLKEFQTNRQGCVVDRKLAEKYHWQIGEHIPIKGNIYPYDLDLTLVGIYDPPEVTQSLWFHWDYLDEGLRKMGDRDAGNAGIIFVKAKSGDVIPELSKAIDDRFASSDNPTHTQTEQAFAQMFIKMQGNIQNFILFIAVFVVIALTFVAANGMAMSMRERTTEIAVLKAIGFHRIRVLFMILGEAVIIAMIGGLLGVGAGRGIYAMVHELAPQVIPISRMPWSVMFYGMVVAAGIGLASGLVPAILAARLSVIDGLRRVV